MTPLRYFCFFCGQVGMMSLARFFFQWITKFTNGPEGSPELLNGFAVGTVLLLFRVFDGVTDPIAGTLSDRWSRAGRARRQLLWFSLAFPGIGLLLTFLPSEAMPVPLRWVCVVVGMFIFFVGYTFYAIPYWSLIGDYAAGDPRRRRVMSNLLGGGMVAATGIGFVLSGILIKAIGFAPAAGVFAVAAAVLMAMPYFAAPRNYQPRPAAPDADPPVPLLQAAKMALRHRKFLALMALFSGSQMSFTIMTAAAPFIAENLLGGDEADIGLIMGPLLGMAVPVFFIVPMISRRIGWLRGMLYASIALAAIYGLTGLLGSAVIGSPMTTAALLFGLGGPAVALLLGLEPEGVVDCAEERGGGALIGMYFGVFNFVVKILNGIAIMIALGLASLTKTGDWGNAPVRWMSFVAGGCLLLGVLMYYVIRPREDVQTSP